MDNNKKIKKIGIDARFYGPIGKGLGRYTQEIVDNIIKIDSENKYVIFLSKDNFDEFICKNERVKKVLVNVLWYTLFEQILMPFFIFKEKVDLMHFPHFNVPLFCPVKFVVTIHDLILTKFPTTKATKLSPFFYKIKNLAYKIIIWLAVKRSRKIITVSEFTKKDIMNHFKINSKKIFVTYEGVANLTNGRDSLFALKLDDRETLSGYNIRSPFLLYVGNAYPHKNLEGLIEVFYELQKEKTDLHLVLVGKSDYFYKRAKAIAEKYNLWRKDNNSPIVFSGYVPDEKLEVLFKKALAYVFPSFYEGFGLPPLEAMARGCAVVSSNKSSMPEILGDAAIYFNPEKKEEMANQIKKIIENENLRKNLIKKGYEQVKKYSWWECGRKTFEIYKEILKI